MGVYLYGEMMLSGRKALIDLAHKCFQQLQYNMSTDNYNTVHSMLFGDWRPHWRPLLDIRCSMLNHYHLGCWTPLRGIIVSSCKMGFTCFIQTQRKHASSHKASQYFVNSKDLHCKLCITSESADWNTLPSRSWHKVLIITYLYKCVTIFTKWKKLNAYTTLYVKFIMEFTCMKKNKMKRRKWKCVFFSFFLLSIKDLPYNKVICLSKIHA